MWLTTTGGADDGTPDVDSGRDPAGDRGRGAGENGAVEIATAKLRLAAAVVILVVWAVIYLRAALDKGFDAPPELSAVMMVVVAWLFTTGAASEMRKRR